MHVSCSNCFVISILFLCIIPPLSPLTFSTVIYHHLELSKMKTYQKWATESERERDNVERDKVASSTSTTTVTINDSFGSFYFDPASNSEPVKDYKTTSIRLHFNFFFYFFICSLLVIVINRTYLLVLELQLLPWVMDAIPLHLCHWCSGNILFLGVLSHH